MSSEGLRSRKPAQVPTPEPTKPNQRHAGLLQDQLRRAQRRPWTPSFSLAVRMLLLIRVSSAMYSNISDCDEGLWIPDMGTLAGVRAQKLGVYSASLSSCPTRRSFRPSDKRPAFFALRISLAIISTLVEAKLYRTIVERINERVGRYYFFLMFFSAGMWNAAPAFLPSSFTMMTSTLAFAYAFQPTAFDNKRRTLFAVVIFALGGIVGWPFALALAIPFVVEELVISGADVVSEVNYFKWKLGRVKRLAMAVGVSGLLFIPVIAIDSIAYGKFTITSWNIVKYNIFGGSERGPELYGTEPWDFYLKNLFINFNIALPLALLSLPALALTYHVDNKRLGYYNPKAGQSSPFTLLAFRLAPFYVWFGILSRQPHKEERFMYPAYPLLCFNAAVTLYLARGYLEVLYIKRTKSPYKASQSSVFSSFTFAGILVASLLSVSRIFALWHYYHAPLTLVFEFQTDEIPRLLNATGLLPAYTEGTRDEHSGTRIDLSPIGESDLRMCVAKEWYRFPGHYLIPTGVRVDFVKSEFGGLLPRHFEESLGYANQEELRVASALSLKGVARDWWVRPQSTYTPQDLNDLNKEEEAHYVDISQCDYLIDSHTPSPTALEPDYSTSLDRVACYPFLSISHSSLLTRMFYLPLNAWQKHNTFHELCLLKNGERVGEKERRVRVWREEKDAREGLD